MTAVKHVDEALIDSTATPYARQATGLFAATVLVTAIVAMIFYAVVSYFVIEPSIESLYIADKNSSVTFALTHAYDGRQYVYICTQGYVLPAEQVVYPRIDWMPVYALMQCGLHQFGVSLVYTGWLLSIMMIGVSVAFASLILRNLRVAHPWFYSLALLSPAIGGAWLYLAGVEATFLAVGMIVLWLVTLPPPSTPAGDLRRAGAGLILGLVFILTKPNALALLLPLIFAFLFQSWKRSQNAGYSAGFGFFVADIVIEHSRPVLLRVGQWLKRPITLEYRPIVYDWAALTVVAGIGLGFAFWLWYTSDLTGLPLYFLKNQQAVSSYWPAGNVPQMGAYFLQMFRGWQLFSVVPAWRYDAAWSLAVMLSGVFPAASKRVPPLIRGMLLLSVVFTLYTGTLWGSTRYVLSTAIVAVGWACWLAPTRPGSRWQVIRIVFLVALCVITSLILVDVMMPAGEPGAWGVIDQ
jgi:hypothetical protein